MICVTVNHQHYIVKEAIGVCEKCPTARIKHKFLHKVAEDLDLKPREIIYIDLSSQKKLWRFQELVPHTRLRHKTKMVFLHEGKIVSN